MLPLTHYEREKLLTFVISSVIVIVIAEQFKSDNNRLYLLVAE